MSRQTERRPPFDPFLLGRYRVVGLLGSGAMGSVYRGKDATLDREVAIKTIRFDNPDLADDGAGLREAFMREARIAARLDHSGIARIFDIGAEAGCDYFVMEYVEGKTLEARLRRGAETFTLTEKLSLLTAVARALAYAHQRGVIHRDIKPANIVIKANGDPKIMDFGIAKLHGGSLVDRADAPLIYGTPRYMSPEQVTGAPVDPSSDIFSLGVVAYRLFTGVDPFVGADLADTLRRVTGHVPPAPCVLDPSLPPDVDRIVMGALVKEKDARYRFAGRLADDLDLLKERLRKSDESVFQKASVKREVIDYLKRDYVFFADFDDVEIVQLFNLATKEIYKPGEVIFYEGSRGGRMYIVIDGRVKVEKSSLGRPVEIATFGRGGCFGEMAFIDQGARSATVTAVEETALIAVSDTVLKTTHPEICLKLYKNLAEVVTEKLRRLTEKYMG
jgi:serine/threonine-protein kinase